MLKKAAAMFLALAMALSVSVITVQAAPAPTDKPGATIFHNGSPSGMTLMPDGRWLIADSFNRVVWVLREGGTPEIYAGRNTILDINNRPIGGYNDAPRKNAVFGTPWEIVPFLSGYVVSDTENNVVRYISSTSVQTAIGSKTPGYEDGYGTEALLRQPTGLAYDDKGNVYIADTGNNCIRMLDPHGYVTTFAGVPRYYTPEEYDRNFKLIYANGSKDGESDKATFNQPTGLYWYQGALYVADSGNHKIRKIQDGIVSTVAGVTYPTVNTSALNNYSDDAPFSGGFRDGAVSQAEFSNPQGVLVTDGAIYVTDPGNGAVRVIKNGTVSTILAPSPETGSTYPVSPRGLDIKNGVLYVTDTYAGVVYIPVSGAGYTYQDVARTDWFANSVAYVTVRGVMQGTGNNNYSPLMTMNRGMTIRALSNFHTTLVNKGAAIEGPAAYTDTPAGQYYTDSANWAKARGISVRDAGTSFNPSKAISREEFVMFLYAYAKSVNLDTSYSNAALDNFNDKSTVSADAVNAVAWAVSKGIMQGTSSGNLDPLSPLSRAAIAELLAKYCKVYGY